VQELEFNWRLVLVTLIGFLGSACGTVGGLGGGGIFDTKSAAALSKCKPIPSIFFWLLTFFQIYFPFGISMD